MAEQAEDRYKALEEQIMREYVKSGQKVHNYLKMAQLAKEGKKYNKLISSTAYFTLSSFESFHVFTVSAYQGGLVVRAQVLIIGCICGMNQLEHCRSVETAYLFLEMMRS